MSIFAYWEFNWDQASTVLWLLQGHSGCQPNLLPWDGEAEQEVWQRMELCPCASTKDGCKDVQGEQDGKASSGAGAWQTGAPASCRRSIQLPCRKPGCSCHLHGLEINLSIFFFFFFQNLPGCHHLFSPHTSTFFPNWFLSAGESL